VHNDFTSDHALSLKRFIFENRLFSLFSDYMGETKAGAISKGLHGCDQSRGKTSQASTPLHRNTHTKKIYTGSTRKHPISINNQNQQ